MTSALQQAVINVRIYVCVRMNIPVIIIKGVFQWISYWIFLKSEVKNKPTTVHFWDVKKGRVPVILLWFIRQPLNTVRWQEVGWAVCHYLKGSCLRCRVSDQSGTVSPCLGLALSYAPSGRWRCCYTTTDDANKTHTHSHARCSDWLIFHSCEAAHLP